jgi:DNA repair exonuclease SbcCD nuclease subunit
MKKIAMFTDIHFGRMNNSDIHNQDCLNYIDWFCDQVKNDKEIDGIFFLGDWHEHRNSINGMTLKYSYEGMSKLNNLGVPVYVIIGNHDLYFRNNREVFTTNPFESLSNITLVNEILELKKDKLLICPYLFPDEYASLINYDVDYVFGHFEFKGFVVTGEYRTLDHGPEHGTFKKFKRIFSGHFHRRQNKDNVHYIGNAFPADFGDANDFERGMCIFDIKNNKIEYKNWVDCPKYVKCNFSDIINSPKQYLFKNARIRCIVDVEMTLEESSNIKEKLIKKYNLRELSLEEQYSFEEKQGDTNIDLTDMEMESTSNLIKEMIRQMKSDTIDNQKLLRIYEEL